jgi:hypothetical protein
MKTLEQAARMALEALEKTGIEGTGEMHDAAIASLRQALEQPKQEPVAWWNPRKDTVSCDPVHRHHPDCTPLYTEPPKREWIGLTDEERKEAKSLMFMNSPFNEVVSAIENRLKEKNA